MNDKLTLSGLFGDFRTLLILFVAFRVVLLLGYQPFLLDGQERGVSVGGDRAYHYALSALLDDGQAPFRDWWSEFPPVWYLTTSGIYALLGRNASYDTWSLALGVLVILSEVGNLMLMRRIGTRLHGANTGMTLAWIYALLVAPIVYMWWNFDTLLTFFSLLSVWLLLDGAKWRSAGMAALGALTKFVSFLLFGAVLRFYPLKDALRYVTVAIGLFMMCYLPLVAINSEFALISLTAQFNKPSYQTVWAILDGNYTTGNFGTIESHLTADGVRDGVFDKNPSVIPSVVRLVVAGLIGLWVFWRTVRLDQMGVVAFFGITLLIFYLQSQGWSPQWLTLVLPLILLVFPTRNGVLISVMLTLLAFIEYPFIFIRTGDTGGVIVQGSALFMPWVLVVSLRTLLLMGVCVAFYGKLRQRPNPDLAIG